MPEEYCGIPLTEQPRIVARVSSDILWGRRRHSANGLEMTLRFWLYRFGIRDEKALDAELNKTYEPAPSRDSSSNGTSSAS